MPQAHTVTDLAKGPELGAAVHLVTLAAIYLAMRDTLQQFQRYQQVVNSRRRSIERAADAASTAMP